MRIGQNVNRALGGTRMGPYTFLARPKGSSGPFVFEVAVQTDAQGLSQAGEPVDFDKARAIRETFVSATVAPPRGDAPPGRRSPKIVRALQHSRWSKPGTKVRRLLEARNDQSLVYGYDIRHSKGGRIFVTAPPGRFSRKQHLSVL